MAKTFIVPTDFSQNAQHASDYAVQLAAQLHAGVQLMHVFQEPIAVSEYELTTIHFHAMESKILQQLEERKEALQKVHGNQVPITCAVYDRDLIGRIQEAYHEEDARLAIIGLTGSGMTNFFLGSNTLNIVNTTGRTILTVPPYAPFRPIRNIVFACDMDHVADTVPAARIKRILQVLQARLHVLHVQRSASSPPELEKEKEALRTMLQGIDYTFHSISHRNITVGIRDFARKNQADLIAIIPRKHDFLENLLRVNHTKAMLFRSSIPILTIPTEEG